jgi:hypothetical protein
MIRKVSWILSVLVVITAAAVAVTATTNEQTPSSLAVHEWGTFTSVAGLDGKPMPWLPLGGPNDLPCFVEYYQNLLFKVAGPGALANAIDYNKARAQLLGTIRMETPVLYFYSPKREVVKVGVAFPQGFVTEWYPKATVTQSNVTVGALDKSTNTKATIKWNSVEVLTSDSDYYPRGLGPIYAKSSAPSHYYAARNTDANPLRVEGLYEKFLFYRGVGNFPVPLNVTVTPEGQISVKHLAGKPSVILFESRGGKLGYTVVDTSKNEALLDSPALTGNFDALRHELEHALVAHGLYEKEATAMVDTWRDSWFEEGTRIFYIVPSAMVDKILPLSVDPKPQQTARVFVGRVEVLTPTTLKAVETALAANDTSVVNTYGRFLGPIIERLPAEMRTAQGASVLNAAFKNYVEQAASCRR